LRDQARLVERAAVYTIPFLRNIRQGERIESVPTSTASWDFFVMLGVRPALGRFFTADEDRPPDGTRVIVLGHELWRRAFDGDTGIVGTTTRLSGQLFTIIGVAPPGFTGVELDRVEAWIPISLTRPVANWATAWNAQWLNVVARLKPDVTLDAASAEATQIHRSNYAGTEPEMAAAEMTFRPIRFGQRGAEVAETTVARWLVGVSLIVLLVACANVGNLLLARAVGRQREIAVRLAVGISAGRLWRLLLLEGLVLSLAGCVAGLVLAYWGGSLIRAVLLPDLAWITGPVDARVFAVAAAVAIACGVAVGLLPAVQTRRLSLSVALKAGSAQSGAPRSRLRATLLFAQCALSVLLLVGAGLFIRSLQRARGIDMGFRPEHVLRAQFGWAPATAPAEEARRKRFYLDVLERLRATRGVNHAAIAVGTPFGFSFGVDLRVPGYDSLPRLAGGGPNLSVVTNDYFEVMGTQVVSGRTFGPGDREGSERVAIVNAPMARALWPNEGAVGKCMYVFNDSLPCARIVGVVGEMRRRQLREPPSMQYYVPFGQELGVGGSALMIQPAGTVQDFVPQFTRLAREMDPTILTVRTEPMQTVIDPLFRQWKLGATLFVVFGALALAIAAVGLYSVIAYMVAQRTSEFGVRMALGATGRRIVSLVLRSGLTVASAGLLAGLVAALLAGRFIEPLLFETPSRDPVIVAGVVVILLLVSVTACLIPASRASRVDPITALRAD
ncbi:MAG: ADOP family duplicated permease, partial [Gemmatimonadaceae bacterium]